MHLGDGVLLSHTDQVHTASSPSCKQSSSLDEVVSYYHPFSFWGRGQAHLTVTTSSQQLPLWLQGPAEGPDFVFVAEQGVTEAPTLRVTQPDLRVCSSHRYEAMTQGTHGHGHCIHLDWEAEGARCLQGIWIPHLWQKPTSFSLNILKHVLRGWSHTTHGPRTGPGSQSEIAWKIIDLPRSWQCNVAKIFASWDAWTGVILDAPCGSKSLMQDRV